MPGGGELEPKDSRRVVGTKGDPQKSWREEENPRTGRGEYEPVDSRNVTGQASNPVDRWQDTKKNTSGAAADDSEPSERRK
ncbi:hypothetical protein ABVV53_14585 [Novosphingobium sp. RD2P27]|uniref:Uncharacterized protein n=1 Tax=Novosphingobium kalidii TaxID=3230299 RepID=A0ABV2D470_9SPHN